MNSDARALQALAESDGEVRDPVEASPPPDIQTDVEIAPLIQKVGATSLAELENLMDELQKAKTFLQSEQERVQREAARYMNLSQTASASVKIIFDTVRGWREAGHPIRNQPKPFEITPAPATNIPADRQAPQAGSVQNLSHFRFS